MASGNEYRTVHGFVQFDPREGEAAGKPVRNITVNGVDRLRYSATLWPSHEGFEVGINDLVTLEGKYTTSPKDDGGKYHNLSVIRAFNHGTGDVGVKPDTDDNDVSPDGDEDIPF